MAMHLMSNSVPTVAVYVTLELHTQCRAPNLALYRHGCHGRKCIIGYTAAVSLMLAKMLMRLKNLML